MRILVISDRYPPLFEGGYEIICREVNQILERRGHKIRVLTTTFGIDNRRSDGEIHRIFDYDYTGKEGLLGRAIKEMRNKRLFLRHLRNFQPDLISIWHPTYLSKGLLIALNSLSIPVVLNLEDHWLIRWFYKKKWKPLEANGVWFVSDCLKAQHQEIGFPVSLYPVIYNGLDLARYPLKPKKREKEYIRLLWAGRIADYKGTHTALEALEILTRKMGITNIRLSIVGEASQFDKEYLENLKTSVQKKNISDYVSFEGQVPYENMVERYLKSDIFLFTSIYKEPFGICWLEAFACGVPVVGTTTGASREFFIDGENAITYEANDPASLAAGIRRLLGDEDLYYKIQKNAINLVKKGLSLEAMVDKIESLYQAALRSEKKIEFSPRKDYKEI